MLEPTSSPGPRSEMQQATSPASASTSSATATCTAEKTIPCQQHRSPLKLPKTPEEWEDVDKILNQLVVPRVLAEKDIKGKSEALCSGVYSVFASTFGTKPIPSHEKE